MAFLIDDDVPVKPQFMEKENIDKLAAFKELAKTGRNVVWWKTTDDLAQKVTAALYNQIARTERPGWIRNGTGVGESEINEQKIKDLKDKNSSLEKELLQLKLKKQNAEIEVARIRSEWKNAIEFVSRLHEKDIEYLQRNKTKIQRSKHNIYDLAIKYGYCDESGKITEKMQNVLEVICNLDISRFDSRVSNNTLIIK